MSGGGVSQYLSSAIGAMPHRTAPPPPSVAHILVNRRTFAQIHSEYGVPILRDKELYLQRKAQQEGAGDAFKSQGQEKGASPVLVMNLVDI